MVFCMPILNLRMRAETPDGKSVPGNAALQRLGPRIPATVGIHGLAAKALDAQNSPIPSPVAGVALIDTGATVTSIDKSVAEELRLAPNGMRKLGTAGGPTENPTYAFRVNVANMFSLDCSQGVECDLSGQGIVVLLGMDLLSRCVLIVNGPDGSFTLSM